MNEEQPEEYIEEPEGYIEEGEDEYQEEERALEEGEFDMQSPTENPPIPDSLGGIYGLFKEVLKKPDSTRVSNLSKEELGELPISVRQAKFIALICRTFNHKGVSNFFEGQASIISDTAMSKSGWFSELFISSKRESKRDSSSSIANLPQNQKKKSPWRVFSSKGDTSQ